MITFIYKEVDYIGAPYYWLEASLQNRFNEGFDIWYDVQSLAWYGIKK